MQDIYLAIELRPTESPKSCLNGSKFKICIVGTNNPEPNRPPALEKFLQIIDLILGNLGPNI